MEETIFINTELFPQALGRNSTYLQYLLSDWAHIFYNKEWLSSNSKLSRRRMRAKSIHILHSYYTELFIIVYFYVAYQTSQEESFLPTLVLKNISVSGLASSEVLFQKLVQRYTPQSLPLEHT